MTDLPAPPPEPYQEQETVKKQERDWGARLGYGLILLGLLAFLTFVLVDHFTTTEAFREAYAPAPTAAPSPRPDVNPCAEDTFDANGCAVRMIQGAVKQTGVQPYTIVKIWCAKYATPKAQREIVSKWVAQGAPSRAMARAVLNEILDYCPGMAKA